MPKRREGLTSQGDSGSPQTDDKKKGMPPWMKPKPVEPSASTDTTQTQGQLSPVGKGGTDRVRRQKEHQENKKQEEQKAIEGYVESARQLREILGEESPEAAREREALDHISAQYMQQ
jgi:hypothetical protein